MTTSTLPQLYYSIDHCLLCLSRNLKQVVPLQPIPIATPVMHVPDDLRDDPRLYAGVPLNLNLCIDCGQIQVSHKPDVEFEYRNYAYSTSLSAGLRDHFAAYAADVLESNPLPNGFVVEVGSNDGTLLRNFRDRGLKVLGVDPALRIAKEATEAGLPTLAEFFTESLAKKIRAEHGAADVVIANFVTANLQNMVDFAKGVRALLADDGIAVFETQYGADVIEKNLLDTVYHEHVSYYTVTPLRDHYARHGMKLIDVKRVPTKGGSIRLTFQPHGAGREPAPIVAEILAEEARKGVTKPAYFEELPRWIARIRDEIGTLVAAEEAAGREVAGWGVSIGTSALLPQFGLSTKIAFLLDDDTKKDPVLCGPDYNIPVVPVDELYARNPGAIVVFAWRYIAAIMEKHRAYLENGGTFIVPLPNVTVIRGADAQPPNTIGL